MEHLPSKWQHINKIDVLHLDEGKIENFRAFSQAAKQRLDGHKMEGNKKKSLEKQRESENKTEDGEV